MRAAHLLILLTLASPIAFAQNNASGAPQGASAEREQRSTSDPSSGRLNQRTQRIQVEDAGSRVDELRVGGQTQSIAVQPKAGNMPGYEVQSPDGARSRVGAGNGAETTTAPRVWNVLKF